MLLSFPLTNARRALTFDVKGDVIFGESNSQPSYQHSVLVAMRLDDGNQLWRVPFDQATTKPKAIVNDIVYVVGYTFCSPGCPFNNPYIRSDLIAVNLQDGAVRWQRQSGSSVDATFFDGLAPLYVSNNRLFTSYIDAAQGPETEKVAALDITTSTTLWHVDGQADAHGWLFLPDLNFGATDSALAIDGAQIYQLTANTFMAWTTSNGRPRWSFTAAGTFWEIAPHP